MNAMTHTPLQPMTQAPKEALPIYCAREMVKDGVEARIVLDGQVYTLRITRAGKLILTK